MAGDVTHTPTRRKEKAIDLDPILQAIRDSLDRFGEIRDQGGDLTSALLDLQANVGDLEDAVDKNEEAS